MIARAQQSGIVLMAVIVMLLIIPTAVLLMQQRTSAASTSVASESRRAQLDYVLDAATAHARYYADQNTTCAGFTDFPQTTFGDHSYSAVITQDENLPQRLSLKVSATLADGAHGSRQVMHTAYQPNNGGEIRPTKDMTVDSASSANNFGSSGTLNVRRVDVHSRYSLLGFGLGGLLPPETRIVSAALSLTADPLFGPNAVALANGLDLYALASRWTEAGTWDTKDGNKAWRPGGQPEPYYSADRIAVFQGLPVGTMSVDVTPTIARWAARNDTFYGFLLKTPINSQSMQFFSGDHSDFAARPKIAVAYACPCGRTCLILPRRQYLDRFTPGINAGTGQRECDVDVDYRGTDGDKRWSFNDWQETGDDGDPCAGTVQVAQDPLLADASAYQVKLTADNDTLERAAWLTDATEVVVSFRYRRQGTTSTGQRIFLNVSNGGGWSTLATIEGGMTDTEYQTISVEVPQAMVGAQTAFALNTDNLNAAQYYFIDDFSVSFSGLVAPPFALDVLADATLSQDKPNDRLGTDNELILRHKDGENLYVVLKVGSAGLHAGEVIASATLRLWVSDNRSDQASVTSLYSLEEAWHSTLVTWGAREYPVSNWATPGGTYTPPADPLDVPTVALGDGEENRWMEFDITPQVQSWLDFPQTNHGAVLIFDDTGRGKEVKILSTDDGDQTFKPHVVITL